MKVFMRKVALMLASVGATLATQAAAHATTYYVSNGGNDANNGTSTSTPWASLQKVINTNFLPGDRILLKRGSVWQGYLSPCQATRCSGTSSAYITIDAYDTGIVYHPPPRINGAGTYVATVYLKNQSYWEIKNLDITNNGPSGFHYFGIQVVCDSAAPSARVCRHIYIGHNEVHDVNGAGTLFEDAGIHVASNIHSTALIGTTYVDNSNYWDDVVIEYNYVHDVADSGILAAELNNEFTTDPPSDPLCINTLGYFDCTTSKAKSTNVKIRNNTVSRTTGNAILLGVSSGGVEEFNVVSDWGLGPHYAAGVWSYAASDTTIQHNEVYGSHSGGDRTAFDLDWGNVRTIIEYNYSHNNYGGMLLFTETYGAAGSTNTWIDQPIVRFNISRNDGIPGGAVVVVCNSRWSAGPNPFFFLNNSIFQSAANFYTGSANTTDIFGDCDEVPSNPPQCDGSAIIGQAKIYNNVFVTLGTAIYPRFGVDTVFDRNVFYRPTGAMCEPSDAHKITGNPVFVSSPSDPAVPDDFKLKSTSPALLNGAIPATLGTVDYFGNTVSSTVRPNRGAYDGPGL